MPNGGYIKIWRKIKNHSYWKEPRKFSRFEAWMDLVMTAAGLDHEVYYRGQLIKLKRGQLIMAGRIFAKRWGWSRERYHRFTRNCLNNGEIRYHRRDHRFSIISIIKYSTYNPLSIKNETTGEATDRTTDEATDRTNINKDKRSIKRKKEIKPLARSKKISEPQITFDFEKRKFMNITQRDLDEWKDTFPLVDIEQKIKALGQWLLSNPSKKKKNYRRFLTNNISRDQEKGGSKLSYQDQRKKKLDEWEKKPLED